MKRFLKWLETKFSRHSAADDADEPHTPVGVRVRVKPKDIAEEEYSVELAFGTSVPDRVESDEPGENVLNPDKCADDTSTQPGLTILKESSYEVIESTGYEVIESTGFDPYNSGSFDPSKTWKSRSRK